MPSIFLEPNFDLSKQEFFFTVFPNIFLTLDTHVNNPVANIKISDKSIQEKVLVFNILFYVNFFKKIFI